MIGHFYIRGSFRPPARGGKAPAATLLKYYVMGTGDKNENFGHLVRYDGEFVQVRANSVLTNGQPRKEALITLPSPLATE